MVELVRGEVLNEAIVIPENIDAVRALAGTVANGQESIRIVESRQHRAYLAPPWKLIWHIDGKQELFHLENDPLELNDRAGQEPAVREELSEKLWRWVEANLGGKRTDPIYATNGAWTCYIRDSVK